MRQVPVESPIGNPRNQCISIRRDHGLDTADQLSRNLESYWKTVTKQQLQTTSTIGKVFKNCVHNDKPELHIITDSFN